MGERSVRTALALPVLIAMIALIHAAPSRAAAWRAPVSVEDAGALEDIARALNRDPQEFKGHAVEVSSGAGTLILLLDGTEMGRLGGGRAEAFLESHPEVRRALDGSSVGKAGNAGEAGEAGAAGGKATWLSSFLAEGDWLRLGRWEERLAVEYRVDYLYSDVLVRRNRVGGALFKRFKGVYLGGDFAFHAFKGELADSVPRASEAGAMSFGLDIGVDFLRYRLGRAPLVLPEYFWAEKDLEGKWFARRSPAPGTTVVRLFEDGAAPAWEHAVEAKLGALRYSLSLAPEAYKSPIHQASLEDLPGVLGTWGMGALLTPDGFIPGGWYRFHPLTLHRFSLLGASRPVQFWPGRITYYRSARDQFRLAFAGELRLGL